METIKVKDVLPAFETFANKFAVKRIKDKMLLVCDEQPEYVADELLLLSEEILSQVSAYGVCLYLQYGGNLQSEKNNDYILHELFLHNGHQNSGPVFFSVRALVQELPAVLSDKQNELFNSESDINVKLQELAAFRNALMHGFFKLPSKKNEEMVEEIQNILEVLLNLEIFKHKADFHFWNNEGFSGHWNIQDNNEWKNLAGDVTPFEKLARKANEELHSADFVNALSVSHLPTKVFMHETDIKNFIFGTKSSDFKESLYVQFHPRDYKQQDEFYASTYSYLNENQDLKIISYSIESEGIGFTSYLLYHIICKKIGIPFPKKDIKEKIGKAVKEKRLVILINNIHLAPFASDHITSLMKFFKEFGIYFIGIGWEYEHLNSIFSQKLNMREKKNVIPNETYIEILLKNHTRQRGPFVGEDDYNGLDRLIQNFCKILKDKKQVIARQYADEQNVDTELVIEALYILYPHFKYDQSGDDTNYKKDDLDELYGFPKNQTETSSIFLTLGRRDIDLEYKHKILKP